MAQQSKIEWMEASWNPVTGCTKVSAGCASWLAPMCKNVDGAVKPIAGYGLEAAVDAIELALLEKT